MKPPVSLPNAILIETDAPDDDTKSVETRRTMTLRVLLFL